MLANVPNALRERVRQYMEISPNAEIIHIAQIGTRWRVYAQDDAIVIFRFRDTVPEVEVTKIQYFDLGVINKHAKNLDGLMELYGK